MQRLNLGTNEKKRLTALGLAIVGVIMTFILTSTIDNRYIALLGLVPILIAGLIVVSIRESPEDIDLKIAKLKESLEITDDGSEKLVIKGEIKDLEKRKREISKVKK